MVLNPHLFEIHGAVIFRKYQRKEIAFENNQSIFDKIKKDFNETTKCIGSLSTSS